MKKNNRVLVVAAHPDDEVLGCGATIARHADAGDIVDVIIAAEGLTSRDTTRNVDKHKKSLSKLAEVAIKANKLLGAKETHFLNHPDNRMDSLDLLDVVKSLEEKINKINPTIVYTHFPSDLNVDHQIVSQAVLTACRPLPGTTVESILFFEVLSATGWFPGGPLQSGNFHPNVYVNVEKQLNRKLKALDIYHDEMRPFPHARSLDAVKALTTYRGASAGLKSAEAFQLARQINY